MIIIIFIICFKQRGIRVLRLSFQYLPVRQSVLHGQRMRM